MTQAKAFMQNQQLYLVHSRLISVKTAGIIAGTKRLIDAGDIFFNPSSLNKVSIIDAYDTLAISTFDLLHNNESGTYFLDKNNNFTNVVEKILIGNNYEIAIRPVQTTDNTSYGQKTILRLKHANSDYSFGYKDAVVSNPSPVVLAHGMHSDLSTWDSFGTQLAQSGRDTWQIEMYGGPTTECDTCGNYTFDDLKTDYWPALMMGVQEYSGQNNLSYVGYDLGCTVGLEALELYQEKGGNNVGYYFDYNTGQYVIQDLTTHPVGTFVGVACLGNFSPSLSYEEPKLPFFGKIVNVTNYDNNSMLSSALHGHIPGAIYKTQNFAIGSADGETSETFLIAMGFSKNLVEKAFLPLLIWSIISESKNNHFPPMTPNALSIGVYQDIQKWMNDPTELDVGHINVTNFAIIQSVFTKPHNNSVKLLGVIPFISYDLHDKDTDGFVSKHDIKNICKNVNATNNKYYIQFEDLYHFSSAGISGMADDENVRNVVINFLENGFAPEKNFYSILSTQQNCEG